MTEHPEPKYLKPELLSPTPERAESTETSAERAAGSTADLVRRSSAELSRSGKDIAGLRAGAPRARLEKRQEILTSRLSGFRKKAAAALAGLALAIGGGHVFREAQDALESIPSTDDSQAAREQPEAPSPEPSEDEDTEEDEEEADVERPAAATNDDPFATPGSGASLEAFKAELAQQDADAKETFEQQQAAELEEKEAIRSYADVVIGDLISTDIDQYVNFVGGRISLDDFHKKMREKAKEIGADEEVFVRETDEANFAVWGAVRKKMIEAPDSLTPAEQQIAEEFRRQDRENAQAAETSQEGSPEDPEKS